MERATSGAGYLIGLVLLAGAAVMLAAAFIAGLRVAQRRKLARDALDELIAAGNIAWRTWRDGHDPVMAGVEDWRATLVRLNQPPFGPHAAEAVLVQWGDRITDPLARLIEIRRNVDDYIE